MEVTIHDSQENRKPVDRASAELPTADRTTVDLPTQDHEMVRNSRDLLTLVAEDVATIGLGVALDVAVDLEDGRLRLRKGQEDNRLLGGMIRQMPRASRRHHLRVSRILNQSVSVLTVGVITHIGKIVPRGVSLVLIAGNQIIFRVCADRHAQLITNRGVHLPRVEQEVEHRTHSI